jgi:CHAD domain-containing protein
LEVEAKFSIPDEDTFQRLLETTSLAGFSLVEPALLDLHDRYLDTPEGTILAGGYACRIRQQDGLTLATLKGLGSASGAIHHRIEHEVELRQPLPPERWPASVARDTALRLSDNQPLVLLFEVNQARHCRHLCDGEKVVAELNLDRGRLYQEAKGGATFLELEAELLPGGSEKILEQLTEELQTEWGLLPQSKSKFERGLALFGPEPASRKEPPTVMDVQEQPTVEPVHGSPPLVELLSAPGIKPDDPMSEAGRKTFRFHYRRMLYNEPGTRLGEDIEALHDMRVATRRMRAAFRIFAPYYEPKVAARSQKGLKRTGRALGPVRDLDVFRAKIRDHLSTLPQSQQDDLAAFLAVLETHRDSARQRMNAYLDSDKYTRFKERFGRFVEVEGLGSRPIIFDDGEPLPYRVRHVAPVVIYQRLAAVRAYDEWVSIPNPPPERLHSLRIACKRLRYTLEFFREVLGPDTKKLIKAIVTVQDHLGSLQDAVVARALLTDYLQRGIWGRETASEVQPGAPVDVPGVEAYLDAKQAEFEQLLESFPEVWRRVQEEKFSQMVAEAIAGFGKRGHRPCWKRSTLAESCPRRSTGN